MDFYEALAIVKAQNCFLDTAPEAAVKEMKEKTAFEMLPAILAMGYAVGYRDAKEGNVIELNGGGMIGYRDAKEGNVIELNGGGMN